MSTRTETLCPNTSLFRSRVSQDTRRHRIRDDRMGGLVQYPPSAQHLELRHSRRVRSLLLLSTIDSPAGDVASIGAARNPARFSLRTCRDASISVKTPRLGVQWQVSGTAAG